MGRYRITIDGVGCHHNHGRTDIVDADVVAAEAVAKLKAGGHSLEAARFEMLGSSVGGHYDKDAVQAHPSNIDLLKSDSTS
jgi:hypothetical protein